MSSGIGITEVDPLVFIERHIVHLQNIVKDPKEGIIVDTWETKGRAVDLCGTLDHLREADLREVRRVAIRLSEFFHDIYLFAGRHAMSVSIAIINVALEAVTKKKLSRAVDIPEELSKANNVASWTVMERYREAGKMFLDWAEYLPGVDLSLRDIIPAGVKSKAVKRRLCRRREIALLTLDVLDQWQSIRDRRVALGLEKAPLPRKTKLADLPTDGRGLPMDEDQVTQEQFVAGIEQWGKTAAVGEDAEVLQTWDDLEPDNEDDWSDVEDPLGLAADGKEEHFFDPYPSEYSRPPSPAPFNAIASSSQVLYNGPPSLTADGLAYAAPSAHDHAYGCPAVYDESAVSQSYSSSPSSHPDTAGSSLALDPSLLTLRTPDSTHYQGAIDPSLLGAGTIARPAPEADPVLDDYPHPSPPAEPTAALPSPPAEEASVPVSGRPRRAASTAAVAKVAGITNIGKRRARGQAVTESTTASVASSSNGSLRGSSEESTIETESVAVKGKRSRKKDGPDPRFLRYSAKNTAAVIEGRKAVPALIPYKTSVTPVRNVASSSVVQFPGAPASSVGAASDFSTVPSAGPSARVVLHRKDPTHVRPSAYMRHRPSDALKHHPYVHLKPAVMQSIRDAGEANTELGRLILDGYGVDELPVHLAPQSILGSLAALRPNGVDDIGDDELFIDGELDGYVRPDEEREFVSKMWDEEGKWEGLEEIIELRERREREERERNERRAERAERRRLNGGKYVRAGRTKATQEMMDKLKALADRETADDGGEEDIHSLMAEYAHFDDDHVVGGGGAGLQRMADRDDTAQPSEKGDEDNKHDSDDESDYDGDGEGGRRAKRAKVDNGGGARGFGVIDPALYGVSHQSSGQSDHENLLAGMDLMSAMRGGIIPEEDEYGDY